MENLGLAELTLGLVGVLFAGGIAVALIVIAGQRGEPVPLARARRWSALRALVATSTALAVFAVAVIVHIRFPLLEAAPFILGPLAAATAGLLVFAVLPAPSIDGAVRRRTAGVEPRRLADYSSVVQRTTFLVTAAITVVVALTTGILSKAAPDGRFLCTSLFPAACTAGGPYLFPGWLFAAPALILIASLVVVVHFVLRRVVTAPATAWPELSAEDVALRRSGVRLVFRVAGASLALTAALFIGLAAFPLMNAPLLDTGLAPNPARYIGAAGMILLGVSAVAFCYGAVSAVLSVVGVFRSPRIVAAAARRIGVA